MSHRHGDPAVGSEAIKRYGLVLLILVLLLFSGWQVFSYFMAAGPPASAGRIQRAVIAGSPTRSATFYHRPAFEAGIVFPAWSGDAYGGQWQRQLPAIQAQTGARWIEMTIFFSQAAPTSTRVHTNPSTPTLESFAAGIRASRAQGFHVFVVPLMGVDSQARQWAGTIHLSTRQAEAQWFDSYWQTFKPYALAAAQNGAEQLAIGTELVMLQQSAPASLWDGLITRLRGVFTGKLTYDMNWSSLQQAPAAWMSNAQLAMIGVSEYLPLVDTRIRVAPQHMPGLWKTRVKSLLDRLSLDLGKPIVISEIGYRNSADALYHSWLSYSTVSPPDPTEQAAACDAALKNVISDPHILGIFFWGWDNVNSFKLAGQPAASVLQHWYNSSQS